MTSSTKQTTFTLKFFRIKTFKFSLFCSQYLVLYSLDLSLIWSLCSSLYFLSYSFLWFLYSSESFILPAIFYSMFPFVGYKTLLVVEVHIYHYKQNLRLILYGIFQTLSHSLKRIMDNLFFLLWYDIWSALFWLNLLIKMLQVDPI